MRKDADDDTELRYYAVCVCVCIPTSVRCRDTGICPTGPLQSLVVTKPKRGFVETVSPARSVPVLRTSCRIGETARTPKTQWRIIHLSSSSTTDLRGSIIHRFSFYFSFPSLLFFNSISQQVYALWTSWRNHKKKK